MVQKLENFIELVNEGAVSAEERQERPQNQNPKKKGGIAVELREIEKYAKMRQNPLTRIRVDLKEDFSSEAITFNSDAIKCIEDSAVGLVGNEKIQRMTSGAGHDSVCTNMHAPTGMIFVPCKDGVSHNPSEWCEEEDCATGANVLLHSVLRMDRLRKERGDFA
jgi:acetylornithine deacetylase/succinyl-diaminopimelate desuccinylase-like protein